jgi:hypothetical protein
MLVEFLWSLKIHNFLSGRRIFRKFLMPAHHLEHFLIQPADLEVTAAWWCDVLDLE